MTRRDAFRWAARPVLLLLWSLVVWGHVLLAAALVEALGSGPRVALARLLPSAGASLWAWLNALTAASAVALWAGAAGVYVGKRRAQRKGDVPGE